MTRSNSSFFRDITGEVYSSYDSKPRRPEDSPVGKKAGEWAMREQAKDHLRTMLRPGKTVYTILNHKNASGTSRSISLVIVHNGEIEKLDYWIVQAKGEHIDSKHGGIKVNGGGMDMGFHLVYNLGRMLWPEGTKVAHGTRNGEPDHDGGYALSHSWL